MKVRSTVRDCLYLNWAVPVERLPVPAEPLEYEVHQGPGGEPYTFVSALLFRQAGLHLAAAPLPRLSYPQCNLRFYVQDGEGVPSVLFARMLVPAWVIPAALWVARQPAQAALFEYPQPSANQGAESWLWSVTADGALRTRASLAAPAMADGPCLGDWDRAVEYFRRRTRGYTGGPRGLRRIEVRYRSVPVWPMAAEVQDTALLERRFPFSPWPDLHSSFLCPEIPFHYEMDFAPKVPSLRRVARPVVTDPAVLRTCGRGTRDGNAA